MLYRNIDGSIPPSGHPLFKYYTIDSHFHLDKLIDQLGNTFRELETLSKPTVTLLYAIANFGYPSKWKLIPHLLGMDPRISFTLGVHPHLLYSNNEEFHFPSLVRELEKNPAALTVGEVELDFTTTCCCNIGHNRQTCVRGKIEAQHVFLKKVLG